MFSDLQLIVKNVDGEYDARGKHMAACRKEVRKLFRIFVKMVISKLLRQDNTQLMP